MFFEPTCNRMYKCILFLFRFWPEETRLSNWSSIIRQRVVNLILNDLGTIKLPSNCSYLVTAFAFTLKLLKECLTWKRPLILEMIGLSIYRDARNVKHSVLEIWLTFLSFEGIARDGSGSWKVLKKTFIATQSQWSLDCSATLPVNTIGATIPAI